MIMLKAGSLSVCQLNLDQVPPSLTPLFTLPFEKAEDPEDTADCADVTFKWCQDGTLVAMHRYLNDYEDPRCLDDPECSFMVVYLLNVASQTIQEVITSSEADTDGNYLAIPEFSPSGRRLIVPIMMLDYESEYSLLNVYDTASLQCLAQLQAHSETFPGNSFAFQPDGRHFAVRLDDGVALYDCDGQHVQHCKVDDGDFHTKKSAIVDDGNIRPKKSALVCVAFAPDGNEVILYRDCNPQPVVDVYDLSSGRCRHMPVPAHDPRFDEVVGLCVSFNSLVIASSSLLFVASIKPESFGQHLLEVDGMVEWASSPDGVFLAAAVKSEAETTSPKYVLRVYQMATGNLLHTYQLEEHLGLVDSQSHFERFTLEWTMSGRHLLLGTCLWRQGSSEVEQLLIFTL